MIMIIVAICFIVIIADVIKDAIEKKQRNKEVIIEGITLKFDFPEIEEYVDAVKKLPEEVISYLSENGWKAYAMEYIYKELFRQERTLKLKFDIEYCREAGECIHICREKKIIFVRKSKGVDVLANALLGIYNAVPVNEEKEICGIKVIFKSDNGSVIATAEGLNNLPGFVLKKFNKEGYTLYILNEKEFNAKYGEKAEGVAGYHAPKRKEIVVKSDTLKCYFLDTLYHEFGHFIDRYSAEEKGHNFATIYNKDVINAYEMAKEVFADKIAKYYLSDKAEFFAYLSAEYFSKKCMLDGSFEKAFERSLAIMSKRA